MATPPAGSEVQAWSRLMPSAAAEMLSGSVTMYDSPAPAKTQMRQPSSEMAMGVPVLAYVVFFRKSKSYFCARICWKLTQ